MRRPGFVRCRLGTCNSTVNVCITWGLVSFNPLTRRSIVPNTSYWMIFFVFENGYNAKFMIPLKYCTEAKPRSLIVTSALTQPIITVQQLCVSAQLKLMALNMFLKMLHSIKYSFIVVFVSSVMVNGYMSECVIVFFQSYNHNPRTSYSIIFVHAEFIVSHFVLSIISKWKKNKKKKT